MSKTQRILLKIVVGFFIIGGVGLGAHFLIRALIAMHS